MSQQALNLVNNIVINAKEKGVAKLVLDNTKFDGKNVTHNGKPLISFGSYSYLGLEVDSRLKEAAKVAIDNYGIQYPSSRIYSSLPMYRTLIGLMEQIFGTNIVLTTSLSLGHMGVMPVVVGQNDLVILDQHVHSSVQDAAQRLKSKGIQITIVRHNDMVDLEKKIQSFSRKFDKVWYAIDGIYSMFGDVAPIEEIEFLLNKYPKLHVYADDAHGVSSFGKNGSGWILSRIKLHPKMVLSTGMAKAFGTMGGVFAIPDNGLFEKVNNCTGSLIFSGPHPIPIIGASIKSAEIHLSDEIKERQNKLQERVKYCSDLLRQNGIPDISDRETPIFFIAVSRLNAGYNLVRKMIDDGFLTNLASFPAVSESCTGLRFTVTLHHSIQDIEALVQAFKRNYPCVLREENLSINSIRRAFRKVKNFPVHITESNQNLPKTSLKLLEFNSITEVNTIKWDEIFSSGETLNSKSLEILEDVFQSNECVEHNWQYRYVQIFDEFDQLILATFFTITLLKEDMLSTEYVSRKLELERLKSPYLLTSKVLLMGTQITEGKQLYIDKRNRNWKSAVEKLLEQIELIQEQESINTVILRDFDTSDSDFFELLKGHGYLKIELPVSHIIHNNRWTSTNEFLSELTKKRRKYIRQIVLKKTDSWIVKVHAKPSRELMKKCHQLYLSVNERSFEINTFNLPFEMFQSLIENDHWELITIHNKEKESKESTPMAMMFAFKSERSYHPILVGLSYEHLKLNIYPQILWQTVKRANELGTTRIHLGFTASQNKRKFGAQVKEKFALVKSQDNFNQILLNNS